MSRVSITKSFLHTDVLARTVENAYRLSGVRCQLITATIRDVYLVVSGSKRHILYIYQHDQRTANEIRAEWEFVGYLYSKGVPVAPAIPTANGTHLLAFQAPEGMRYGVLTPFVEGKHLRQRPSERAVEEYGRIVAQIHVLSDDMHATLDRPVNDIDAILAASVEAFESVAFERPKDTAYVRESADVLSAQVRQFDQAKPAYGMIHGDVIRANAQVADDGTVTILDFDFCGMGWRAFDIASYLLTIRKTPREREFEQAFLRGYTQVRSLAESEQAMIPVFEAVRAIFSIGVPAMNVNHWGRAYLYAFLDLELDRLKNCMERV